MTVRGIIIVLLALIAIGLSARVYLRDYLEPIREHSSRIEPWRGVAV